MDILDPFSIITSLLYVTVKFTIFKGLCNWVLTILHNFQPLYVWGVSAYSSMLIKMLI